MIVWRGRGIVIALIAFACLVFAELFTRSMFVDRRYYQVHGWPKLAGFWLAAALVYSLRSWLGGGRESWSVDSETGKEMKHSEEDSLFHVRVRFWPLILVGLGVVFFFVHD